MESECARVLYIAGYGHSGSTLYGIVLGESSGVLSVGELGQVLERPDLLQPQGEVPPSGREVLSFLNQRIDMRRQDLNAPGFWHELLCDLSRNFGARLIVDGSKTAWRNLGRPRKLRREGLSVFVLHLIRDPRAVAYSLYRKHGTAMASVRALAGWVVSNVCTIATYGRGTYWLSFYEDFIKNPPGEVEALSTAIAFDFSRSALMLRQGEVFEAGCQIDGNRMARSGAPIRVRPDMAWRDEAPLWVSVVGSMGLPLYWLMRGLQRCRRQE